MNMMTAIPVAGLPVSSAFAAPHPSDEALLRLEAEISKHYCEAERIGTEFVDPLEEGFVQIMTNGRPWAEQYAEGTEYGRATGRDAAIKLQDQSWTAGDKLIREMWSMPAESNVGRAAKVRLLIFHIMGDKWRGPDDDLDWDISMCRQLLLQFAGMSEADLLVEGEAPALAPDKAKSEHDPIFAAVEAERHAWAEVNAAIAAEGALEDALPDDDREASRDHARVQYGTCPDANGIKQPRYKFSHQDIDESVPFQDHRARLHAALDADQRWLEDLWARTGFKVARERTQKAFECHKEALRRACATAPTSLPGLPVLVDLLRREVFDGEKGSPGEDIEELAWNTLDAATRSLSSLPALPAPARRDSVDAELSAASVELQLLDLSLDGLRDMFGDDADQRADYNEIERRRFKVLEMLATRHALSWTGLEAKASALMHPSVAEDYERGGAIAQSMAEDIIKRIPTAA